MGNDFECSVRSAGSLSIVELGGCLLCESGVGLSCEAFSRSSSEDIEFDLNSGSVLATIAGYPFPPSGTFEFVSMTILRVKGVFVFVHNYVHCRLWFFVLVIARALSFRPLYLILLISTLSLL